MFSRWLLWSGMRSKVAKCASLTIQRYSGHIFNSKLSTYIPARDPIHEQTCHFLGMRVESTSWFCWVQGGPASEAEGYAGESQLKLKVNWSCMEQVCPRLTWLLTMEELTTYGCRVTWRHWWLDSSRKWAGLARSLSSTYLKSVGVSAFPPYPPFTNIYRCQDKLSS